VVEQPTRAALRDQGSQPVIGIGIRIHGEGFFQHGLEFRGVLRRQAGIFSERDVGAGALALGQLDGAVEVPAHQLLLLIGLEVGSGRLESDQELGNGAVFEALVELRHPRHHGFDQGQFGDHLGAVLGK
jgi:hypothetical protein